MTEIVFTVVGVAQPQGSARAFTYRRKPEKGGGIGARVDSDNPKVKGWRRAVATAASDVRGHRAPSRGPVTIEIVFYLHRPQVLKHPAHITRPDIDKLSRAILDALTGTLWEDDGQVVTLRATKAYTRAGESPRTEIRVRPIVDMLSLFAEVG